MKLNWRLILYLSLFGPAVGTVLVLGAIPRGMERFVWLIVSVFCAVVIARRKEPGPFAHGAVVGFISGATSTLIQGLFVATFVSNNPWVLEEFSDMPEGFDVQFFIMMLVPFIGVASALVGGVLALLSSKVMRRAEDAS